MSSPTRRFDLAGTGSMVADLICTAPRIAAADEKILLSKQRRSVGGVTLNHLAWARLLGLRVAIFGKQAKDADGRFLRAGMDRLGIEQHLDLSGSASSFAQVFVDSNGNRAIYMARGATGELRAEEIDVVHREVIESAAIVSTEISQVPLETVQRVLQVARGAGARTVVDLDVPLQDAVPSLGTDEQLHAVLGLADVIKPSLASVEGLVRATDPEEIAAELAARYGAKAVVLTCGSSGAVVFAERKPVAVPAPRVAAVDTTGAGDAFLGGFVAGLHYDLGWVDAARLGTACGSCCCEQLGAFPEDAGACRERSLELYSELGGGHVSFSSIGQARAADGPASAEAFLRVATQELARVAEAVDSAAIGAAGRLIRSAEAEAGRVHVTGVGKSEHVARYAAALLSSTGTPAVFLHATEATHGGVGQVCRGDVLIALSNSGETAELLDCVRAAQAMGSQLIAVTGVAESALGSQAEVVLEARVDREGDALDLAPRASVLAATLILGALSVELQTGRQMDREQYHRRHPAGALGRRSAS